MPDLQGIAEIREEKVTKYIITHENAEVLILDAIKGDYQIINAQFLPFGLRIEGLTCTTRIMGSYTIRAPLRY